MASGKMGLVGIGAIGFDEVPTQKMPKEVVTTLKTYCESGTFAVERILCPDGFHRYVREYNHR